MHLSVFSFFKRLNHFVSNCLQLLCSSIIGLDLESHSREKVQFFETRLRIILLALTWRDEIVILKWPFSYFETRTWLHIIILVLRDEIKTLENHFSWSSKKNEAYSRREFPGSRILADLCYLPVPLWKWGRVFLHLSKQWNFSVGKRRPPHIFSLFLHTEILGHA